MDVSSAGGTSIRIFLPDGSPEGVRLVSKANWSGVGIACPRSKYSQARVDRPEFRAPGVYVLLGPDEEGQREARIYVGEGEDPRKRIDDHHARKDFWNRVVLFTSPGQTLNKAAIRYLEARLLQLATKAGRTAIENGTAPALPPLSEPDQVDAEAFLADMLIIYPLLGVAVFEQTQALAAQQRLHLTGPEAAGEGAETGDGFVVFAGALARVATVASAPPSAVALRESMIEAGLLEPTPDGTSYRLTADHRFTSPSAAAAVLLGRTAPGPLEWRDSTGATLKQLRERAVSK